MPAAENNHGLPTTGDWIEVDLSLDRSGIRRTARLSVILTHQTAAWLEVFSDNAIHKLRCRRDGNSPAVVPPS